MLDRHLEPGAGVVPLLPNRVDGEVHDVGDLFAGQAGKEAELDDAGGDGVLGGQAGQNLVQGE